MALVVSDPLLLPRSLHFPASYRPLGCSYPFLPPNKDTSLPYPIHPHSHERRGNELTDLSDFHRVTSSSFLYCSRVASCTRTRPSPNKLEPSFDLLYFLNQTSELKLKLIVFSFPTMEHKQNEGDRKNDSLSSPFFRSSHPGLPSIAQLLDSI